MENETGLKLVFWISTIMMLLMTIAILAISLVYRKNTYKIKQKESENLLKASMESEKRERQRIAADFHDSVSGDLNAIRNYITILAQSEDDEYKKTIISEIKSGLDNTLNNVQYISYNLMPPMLESSGLIPTLQSYFDRVIKMNNITISFSYYQRDIPITLSIAYELFRIIQELISNMIKHGKSTQIDLSIEKNNEVIELKITDNGATFDLYKSLQTTSGMGLKNIISRTKYINAFLTQEKSETGNLIVIRLKN